MKKSLQKRLRFLDFPLKFSGSRFVARTAAVVLLLLYHTIVLNAQQITVTGTVNDEKGNPLAGVTVIIKGTTIGTTTDEKGRYTLPNVPSDATLQYSFIGMATLEQNVSGRATMNVSLREEAIGLDEIVVVGYGTQTKKTLSGAVSAVQSDQLVRTISPTASGNLVGKIAGITARITDARPGASTSIQIRNFGTPLFVIDGVPRTAADFNNLEINAIESISVLKDGSAAIYGLQAENGVVLVSTKFGKITEKPKIDISSYYGLQGFTRFPQHSNSYYYILGQIQSAQNQGQPAPYTPEQLEKYRIGYYDPETGEDYRSFDYYDFVIKQNTPAPQYNLTASASGASDRSSYFFSATQFKQNAVIESYWYRRQSVQANLEAKLTKGLKIGTQLVARYELRHQAGVPGIDDYPNIFSALLRNWPTERPYANDNPLYVNQTHSININPATYKESFTGWTDESDRDFDGNIYAEYDFGFGLKARGTISYGYHVYLWECFEYTYDAYKYNYTTKEYEVVVGGGNQNPFRETRRGHTEDKFAQFQLTYNKKFGKHSVAAVAAYEQMSQDYQYLRLHTIPPTNFLPIQNLENEDYLQNIWNQSARASYITRLNYNYGEKYLLEFVGRYDGSYMYAPSRRWGFFPGISLGWRISNESFFIPLKNVLTDLKLRVSYGETGSETGVSAFDYLDGFNWASGNYIFNGTTVTGIGPRGLPVRNLTWVVNHSTNIGFDFELFNGKFTGQFDVFQRKRTGIPAARYDVLLPSEVGYSLPNENLNATANVGVEGAIDYNSKIGPVNYTVGINATLARARSLYTYKPRFGSSWDEYRNSTEDRWSNIHWGYHVIGQFKSLEQIENYPVDIDGRSNTTLLPGDLIYEDLNGDKIINTYDQKPIGYATGTNPYMSLGINNSFRYKGFSLVLDFAGGFLQTYQPSTGTGSDLKIPYANNGASPMYLLKDAWHRADPFDATSPWIAGRFPPVRKDNASHSNYSRNSDFWNVNVNYLRLRTLELAYEIPQKYISRIMASRLRIYVNMTNLFCIDNIGKIYELDPEVASNTGRVYPPSRVANFGLNLTF